MTSVCPVRSLPCSAVAVQLKSCITALITATSLSSTCLFPGVTKVLELGTSSQLGSWNYRFQVSTTTDVMHLLWGMHRTDRTISLRAHGNGVQWQSRSILGHACPHACQPRYHHVVGRCVNHCRRPTIAPTALHDVQCSIDGHDDTNCKRWCFRQAQRHVGTHVTSLATRPLVLPAMACSNVCIYAQSRPRPACCSVFQSVHVVRAVQSVLKAVR
jgi:hypothetical protein